MKSKSSLSDLEAGRTAYAERRWREACERLVQADRAHPLTAGDLDRLAWSCALLGQNDLLFATLERLYNLHLDARDLRGAARAAFWLGFRLLFLGETGRATAWIATSQRVLERLGEDCAERGYLFLPQGLGRLSQKDAAGACEAARRAAEVGERFGDANLTSLSRAIEGQARLELGEREAARKGFHHGLLGLPRGEERELVVDGDRVYELNGEDSRTLAAVGTFPVVPEQDLDAEHDTLRHLRDEGLVETVDVGNGEPGLTLTKEGRDLLDSHTLERDGDYVRTCSRTSRRWHGA